MQSNLHYNNWVILFAGNKEISKSSVLVNIYDLNGILWGSKQINLQITLFKDLNFEIFKEIF